MPKSEIKDTISDSNWSKHIDYLRSIKDVVGTRQNIAAALKKSILNNLPNEPFGILLSGGVDSSIIAKICKDENISFRCFCVGMKGSEDLKVAKKVAHLLELELVFKEFEIDEIEELLIKVIAILPSPIIHNDNYIEYMVKVSVSTVLLAAISLGDERSFFSGIGAEELFAGYQRHVKSVSEGGKWRGMNIKGLVDESWDGLKRLNNLVISRDKLIAESLTKEVISPYINDELIILAMSLSTDEKIDSITNKKILREIAVELGVPIEASARKKKGAQYGSNFDKAIKLLAKRNGFKLKKRYLDSLISKK
jgi:asparagine synthase (glutamine-hydrolysing)|tara:strand:+ start:68 stop:994 length:927 start_codon:yes stop_codon:yes gene_type:complete